MRTRMYGGMGAGGGNAPGYPIRLFPRVQRRTKKARQSSPSSRASPQRALTVAALFPRRDSPSATFPDPRDTSPTSRVPRLPAAGVGIRIPFAMPAPSRPPTTGRAIAPSLCSGERCVTREIDTTPPPANAPWNLFAFQIPKSDPSTAPSELKSPSHQRVRVVNLCAFQIPKSEPSTPPSRLASPNSECLSVCIQYSTSR